MWTYVSDRMQASSNQKNGLFICRSRFQHSLMTRDIVMIIVCLAYGSIPNSFTDNTKMTSAWFIRVEIWLWIEVLRQFVCPLQLIRNATNLFHVTANTLRVSPFSPFRRLNKYDGQSVILAGWGSTSFAGERSDVLLMASVSVVSLSSCKRKLDNDDDALTEDKICTSGGGISDACQYDSVRRMVDRRLTEWDTVSWKN